MYVLLAIHHSTIIAYHKYVSGRCSTPPSFIYSDSGARTALNLLTSSRTDNRGAPKAPLLALYLHYHSTVADISLSYY